MRKSLVVIAAAGSVFALTGAGAAGLGTLTGGDSVKVVNSGTVTVTTYSCTDPLTVSYVFENPATNQKITGVKLTGSAIETSTCDGQTATVVLSDGSAYARSGSAVFTLSGGSAVATVSLASMYDVSAHALASTSVSVVKN